jgi:hypothetical protein
MDAPLKTRGRRNVVAVLASGVVISLTAMTTGIAPAFADPKSDPISPTTTVAVPEPEPAPQEAPAPKPHQQEAPVIAEPPAAPPAAPVVTQAPKVPEAPVVTQAPVTQAPAPQTQAPAIVQAPPQTQAPATQDAPVTQSVPAKPPTVAPTTATSAPATSAEPPAPPTTRRSVAPSAAPSPTEPEPTKPDTSATSAAPAPVPPSSPVTTSASAPPSEGSTPPSPPSPPTPALVGPPSAEAGATPTSAAESSSTEPTSGVEKTASSSVSQAAKVIETLAPETLKAPEQDVVLAKSAKPVEQLAPVVAPKQDVEAIAKAIDLPNFDRDIRDARSGNDFRNDSRRDDRDDFFPGADRKWDRNVRQWDPNWVEYDDYYRPVLSNPYRNPVKIIYIYQNAPRIVYIPPLARIILEVAQFAAYSFTAIVTNAVNTAVNVAVGSFFGGGYYPGIGLPLPPPPPPLFRYDNVPVQVRYTNNRVYEPFRVQRIVDVGDDRQYGERKVLLDGVTPAWGEWKQTPTGERQFEVHRTQQFPGLDEPREGPLPGDYQLRLASDESSAGFKGRDAFLLTTAVLLGATSLAAVGWAFLLGRRRTQH